MPQTPYNILPEVKLNLRIGSSCTTFDNDEITPLIEACRLDLQRVGVTKEHAESDNALIRQAIRLYCKANFGYIEQIRADKFAAAYDKLRDAISLMGDDIYG
jgi:hypothetical protein